MDNYISKNMSVVLNFGLNLRMLREKAGLSQQQLADQIGVKSAAISKYEKNQVEPKIEYLVKFCQIFDVTLDELILADPKDQVRLSAEEYKANIRALEGKVAQLTNEIEKLKEEKDKLQTHLINAMQRALDQR